jgi:hypothetical protein
LVGVTSLGFAAELGLGFADTPALGAVDGAPADGDEPPPEQAAATNAMTTARTVTIRKELERVDDTGTSG